MGVCRSTQAGYFNIVNYCCCFVTVSVWWGCMVFVQVLIEDMRRDFAEKEGYSIFSLSMDESTM